MKPSDEKDMIAKLLLQAALRDGKVVELGWSSVSKGLFKNVGLTDEEADLMRDFYFLGAAHVVSIIGTLIEGKTVEEAKDVGRKVEMEIEKFLVEFQSRNVRKANGNEHT